MKQVADKSEHKGDIGARSIDVFVVVGDPAKPEAQMVSRRHQGFGVEMSSLCV